jgi:hypothetical protein
MSPAAQPARSPGLKGGGFDAVQYLVEPPMAVSRATRTQYPKVWLLSAIFWVFVVVWLSFQIAHAVFSRPPNWDYLGLAIPLLLAPWLLHRFDDARNRTKT